jgi:hypothetical protein
MADQNACGMTQIFANDGSARGIVVYNLTLAPDGAISGSIAHQDHLGRARPGGVPVLFVASGPEDRMFLELTDGRWVAIYIANQGGEVNIGGVASPPSWARH